MTTAAHGRCRGEDGGPTATADLGNQYRLPGSRRRFCRYHPLGRLEHMFEATPFAVAMSPVVRVADPPGPRNDSAAKLAMVGVLTPGPVAMDLLTQVQIHRLDDVERTEYLVAWERAARWVEAQRMKAVVAVAGATATNRDDFAREHVKVALSGCGGSARADVDLARDMTGRLAAAGAALARGEISYSHARVLSTETFDLGDATAGQVAAAVLRRDEHRTPSQFRVAVRRAVIQADPVRAELAAERAVKERMVAKQALDGRQPWPTVRPRSP